MKLDSTELKDLGLNDEIILASTLNNVLKNIDISENGLSTVSISTDNLYVKQGDSNIEVISLIKDLQKKVDFLIYLNKLKEPLCFTAVDAGATIALKCNGNNLKTATFETSTDKKNWTDYTYATNITLTNVGDKVYFRAKADNTSIVRNSPNYLLFTTTQPTKLVNVSGNIMSLLAPKFGNLRTVSPYAFYKLFNSCKSISDCSSLTLPATQLADYCYNSMFQSCTSLTTAPELPATQLADYCYCYMFSRCTSLTVAPQLPATQLANSCYASMFYNCTSLSVAPELPAMQLANNCYQSMFQNCTSLSTAPQLPATQLASNCYNSMFSSCSSLTAAPQLPATTLADSCYYAMFNSCTSLSAAPALPAISLADSCYQGMFASCTSLSAAPEIKTYVSNINAFNCMLNEAKFDPETYVSLGWGNLTSCNWPDLTLSEAESMSLNDIVFGNNDNNSGVVINIVCKDGNGVAKYSQEKSSWTFTYQSNQA